MLKKLLLLDKKLGLIVCFVAYGFIFIQRSSFTVFDGSRYYCLFDDAMISLRYAWNLAHGLGPVWNPAERVEGYTNPLMVAVMAGISFFFDKRYTVLAVQIAGIVVMLGTAYLAAQVAAELTKGNDSQPRKLVKGLVFGATLAYFPLIFWSLLGMETGLLTLTLVGAVLFTFKFARYGKPVHALVTATLLGLAYLTRPDSSLVGGLILVYLAYEIWLRPARTFDKLRLLLATGSLYAGLVGLHLLFRWLYYGELVPNTYTLKISGMPLGERLSNGVGFIGPFLGESWPVIGLALVGLGRFHSRQIALLWAIFVGLVGYQIYTGGDPWSYWRIVSPAIPLLFVVVGLGLVEATQRLAARLSPGRTTAKQLVTVGLAALVMTLVVIGCDWRFLPEMTGAVPLHVVRGNQINTEMGLALSQVTTAQATLGVVTAGAIPYFADRETYDFLGKVDKRIAHLPPDLSGAVGWSGMNSVPGHNKYDLNYSIGDLRPDFVEVFRWGRQERSDLEQKYYRTVRYRGIEFELRRDSKAVLWDRLQVTP